MSYEIHALMVEPGQATADTLDTVLVREETLSGEQLDPAKEARKRSIASALSTARLGYEVVEHDFESVAEESDKPEDQVRREIRHVQVDNGSVLVEIGEEHSALKVPLSSSLVGEHIVDDVFGTLTVLHDEAKLVPFDPQLGRELDIATDREAFLDSFRSAVEEAQRSGTEEHVAARPRAPWWKRFLGMGRPH